MSILQDFERIHRELGDEKWQLICAYCEKTGHRLDTVLYTEPGWNAFEAYLQNEDASKGGFNIFDCTNTDIIALNKQAFLEINELCKQMRGKSTLPAAKLTKPRYQTSHASLLKLTREVSQQST